MQCCETVLIHVFIRTSLPAATSNHLFPSMLCSIEQGSWISRIYNELLQIWSARTKIAKLSNLLGHLDPTSTVSSFSATPCAFRIAVSTFSSDGYLSKKATAPSSPIAIRKARNMTYDLMTSLTHTHTHIVLHTESVFSACHKLCIRCFMRILPRICQCKMLTLTKACH